MWWPLMVLGLVVAGRLWARLPLRMGRGFAWAGLLLVVGCLHWLLREDEAVLRMVGLCCGLLGGLKGVVYVEWCARGRRELGWGRYLCFGLGWFGMNPGAFARSEEGLEWRSHLRVGLGCVVAGTVLALGVRQVPGVPLVFVFVPMSIGFHYGALRVLTAFWRGTGIPVRVLFRNPLRTTGLADFWAKRWNLGYSEMMARVVKRPLEGLAPRVVAEWAVFLGSGLLHEVAITLPVGAGYGGPTVYFLLHGLALRLERRGWPLWVRRVWVALWVIGPLGLLFPNEFFEEVILRCLHVLPGLMTES
ncbi:MAG: MBOAT family protein [Verrucomicrobia bacterium]|nr:MBOAT family protein [Verrucomicrobiota bacterium]